MYSGGIIISLYNELLCSKIYTYRFLQLTSWVSLCSAAMWLLQVPLRVLQSILQLLHTQLAFVAVASEYHHSTLNGTLDLQKPQQFFVLWHPCRRSEESGSVCSVPCSAITLQYVCNCSAICAICTQLNILHDTIIHVTCVYPSQLTSLQLNCSTSTKLVWLTFWPLVKELYIYNTTY